VSIVRAKIEEDCLGEGRGCDRQIARRRRNGLKSNDPTRVHQPENRTGTDEPKRPKR
jgi:hypothetical protein